jgi:hypothetical protein
MATLNKVVDTTIKIKFIDAMRYFEAAAEEYKALGMCTCVRTRGGGVREPGRGTFVGGACAGRRAAESYARCAEAENRLGHRLASATYLCDAAECMQRTDPLDAVALFQRALAEFAGLGRFLAAAAVQREIAEIHEAQHALFEAATALSNAADYYVGEALPHPAVACLVRAGEHFVEDERYSEAAKRFMQTISICLDDNLMKFNAPQLALTTALCFLALRDDTKAMDFVEQHASKDPLFLVSREKRFLLDIILAAQERRPDDFIDHCWNFDYVFELHPHQLRLLHEIHEAILDAKDAEEGLLGGEEESEDSWVAEEEGDEGEDDEGGGDDDDEAEEGDEGAAAPSSSRRGGDDDASTTGGSTERSA